MPSWNLGTQALILGHHSAAIGAASRSPPPTVEALYPAISEKSGPKMQKESFQRNRFFDEKDMLPG